MTEIVNAQQIASIAWEQITTHGFTPKSYPSRRPTSDDVMTILQNGYRPDSSKLMRGAGIVDWLKDLEVGSNSFIQTVHDTLAQKTYDLNNCKRQVSIICAAVNMYQKDQVRKKTKDEFYNKYADSNWLADEGSRKEFFLKLLEKRNVTSQTGSFVVYTFTDVNGNIGEILKPETLRDETGKQIEIGECVLMRATVKELVNDTYKGDIKVTRLHRPHMIKNAGSKES